MRFSDELFVIDGCVQCTAKQLAFLSALNCLLPLSLPRWIFFLFYSMYKVHIFHLDAFIHSIIMSPSFVLSSIILPWPVKVVLDHQTTAFFKKLHTVQQVTILIIPNKLQRTIVLTLVTLLVSCMFMCMCVCGEVELPWHDTKLFGTPKINVR